MTRRSRRRPPPNQSCLPRMSVNPSMFAPAAPTASSKAVKATVATSGESFGSMVADVRSDESGKAIRPVAEAATDTPQKPSVVSKDPDILPDDSSETAPDAVALIGVALFVPQAQVVQPTAEAAVGASKAIATSADAKSPAEQTDVGSAAPASDAAAFTDALTKAAPLAQASALVAQPAASLGDLSAPDTSTIEAPAVVHPAAATVATDIKQPDVPKDKVVVAADAKPATGITPPTTVSDGPVAAAENPTTAAPALELVAPGTLAAVSGKSSTKSQTAAVAIADEASSGAGSVQTGQVTDSKETLPVAPKAIGSLADAPVRVATHAFSEPVSNAAAGATKGEPEAQPAGSSDIDTKGLAQAAVAPSPSGASAQSATGTTSAFAAQVQAQAQMSTADPSSTALTDTVPTGQGQPGTQTASVSPTTVAASFSGLSRATLDTTVQIAAQITRQLAGRSTRFELGLTPEGLGKVNVSMDIDADGQLTARLAFDNPLAAADMRARADELRGQLQDAGFKLADDALTFSQQDSPPRDSGAGDRRPDQNQGRAFASASRVTDDADAIPSVPAWVSLSLTPRGVDMKV